MPKNKKTFYEKLHDFAQLCNETSGASFTLTKTSRDNEWKITFVNKGVSFSNKYLDDCLEESQSWILNNRKLIIREVKYTLFEQKNE